MVKLHYTYRGAPITPYRPQGSKGPGKTATVIIVLLIISGLLYGAWKLYDSLSSDEEQNESQVYPPLKKPEEPVTPQEQGSTAVVSTSELPEEMVALDREITQLINGNKLEEARAKLQNFLERNNSSNNYYLHAQKKLALCTEKMLKSGKLKKYTTYSVQSGDNLGKISRKFGVTVQAIITESNLKRPDRLQIGQQLRIPAKWYGFIIKSKMKLFVYHADKRLVAVFSLSSVPNDAKNFLFNHKDQKFWNSCGLSINDWKALKSLIPENSNTQISCR